MVAQHEPLRWRRKQLEDNDPDLLRAIVRAIVKALMSADADIPCNAGYGERSDDRARRWDTRVGTIHLAIPKLRAGKYFPEWLLEPRRRAEKALVAVVADCYLAGISIRRVDKLVRLLGLVGCPGGRSPSWPGGSIASSMLFATARSNRPLHASGSTP
jgi:transposase-like protein